MNIQAWARTLHGTVIAAFFLLAIGSGAGCSDRVSQASLADLTEALPRDDAFHSHGRTTESQPSDWPALFGPELTSRSRESQIDVHWPAAGPPVLWRAEVGRGYSSPVVAQGKLILQQRIANEEQVRCLDAATGDEIWQSSHPTTYQCIYLYSDGPYATPLIHQGCVFAISAQARLQCLNLADGGLVWHRDLAADYQVPEGLFGFGAGMLIDGERLFLNAGGTKTDAGIIAVDIHSGETIWIATDHPAAYTTPRIVDAHGLRHLLVFTEIGLTDLDPATGEVRWVYEYHSKAVDTLNAVTPVVQDDLVVLIAGPGPGAVTLRLLPDGNYEEAWKERRLLDSQFNNLIHADGYVFGFTSSRQGGATLRCFEVATGKLQWEHRSLLGRGSSLATREAILLLGEEGHLASLALDPQTARPISITNAPILNKPCYSAPALSNGRLYVRNEEEVICLDVAKVANAMAAKKP